MLAELGERLLAGWNASVIGGPRPRALRYVSVAGRVEGATRTLLAFGDDAQRPLLAVKIHREPDAGARTRAEAELLGMLASAPGIGPSVPRVVLADRVGGSWVLAQTALEGRPMRAAGTDRDASVTLALAWLERLHRGARSAHAGDPRAVVAGAIDEMPRTFDLGPREREYVGSIDVDRVVACGAFVEHFDYAPHNLLVRPGAIGVIDWTDGRPDGPALHDALFLLTTAWVLRSSVEAGAGLDAAFARAYLDEGPARDGVRALLHRHAAALGVDRGAIDALFALFLVRIAVAEAARLRRAHARGSWPMTALRIAAAEGIGPDRVVEAQPWIRFLRLAARRGTSLA